MNKYDLIYFLKLSIIPIILIVLICLKHYGNKQTFSIEVKEKYVKNYIANSKYIVIDNNGNAYQISDTIFRLKFNSTDLYAMLDVGKKYMIMTTGYRIHFFSMYPNIHKIVEITDEGE